ncbi:polysaccharide deacetylase family protein [Fulvivirga sp. M361]|uniref:polysaccharide deacetylase family protein n=1 Tax=Fulvivirga sp. M361 TaxID=2594266 RepID=UPI00117A6816|nr:polysaccharide deacetylase family protein [Fulvivirga sp. M361]TRX57607.1 polysaccharide deacetylase family protein [Fulvivirga sp. M361]
MRSIFLVLLLIISLASYGQPSISFTFDDGSTSDRPGYTFEEWNEMLLDKLDKADIRAVFFIKAGGLVNEKGKYLLNSWNERGHKIGNHTYTHPNFNREDVSVSDFKRELLKTDSLIRNYSNYVKLFRFPYLKEGSSTPKVDSIRQILKHYHYSNGHVTIDASDWYIDSRLRKRLKENPDANIDEFKSYYLQHLYDRAIYYEDLSFSLTGRHIDHTLLLHHNLSAALFLDDLIKMFRSKGWKIMSAHEAFDDPIFDQATKHAGESLIWALAKDSGRFEKQLRYPAEDSRYEKDRMDKLGL